MDNIIARGVAKRVALTLKRRLASRLPWLVKKTCSDYQEVPTTSPFQEEEEENALNHALEAKMMELIANSPERGSHITLEVPPLHVYDEESFRPMPVYQTRCQVPEPQI